MGTFEKILGMYPVGIGWANCFRTHHELTMYPLGKCPLAPSVTRYSEETIELIARRGIDGGGQVRERTGKEIGVG